MNDNIRFRYDVLLCTAMNVIKKCCPGDENTNDQAIYEGIQYCLDAIGVEGLVIHFGKTGLWQACFNQNRQSEGETIVNDLKNIICLHANGPTLKTLIIEKNNRKYIQSTIYNFEVGMYHLDESTCNHNFDDIFLLNPSQELFGELKQGDEHSNSSWYVIFATLREVLVRRNYAFRHFAPSLSWHYWNRVFLSDNVPIEVQKIRREVPTITLSLDLRKSTIAMEQANNHDKYADWMRNLIEELTDIAFAHHGVFDKFTGDGVIIHFLEDDLKRLIPSIQPDCPQETAIELAVVCAARMVNEVEQRLAELRKFLQSDISNLGAAVGLAAGMAKWSSDHAGNPIVVGRGVVGACRAGSGAVAGSIRMTNTAYQNYLKTKLFNRIPPIQHELRKSKDFPEDVMLRLWEFNVDDILRAVDPTVTFNAEPGSSWKARFHSKVFRLGGRNTRFRSM